MSSKIYFPNLNGVRFIAALCVIIHHIEQLKSFFGYDNLWNEPHIKFIGKLGVVLFFVLSGFLITYLLLAEKEAGGIAVRSFYIRRILRIWPLYYLVVLTGLFLLPYISFLAIPGRTEFVFDHFGGKVALYVFFLPNLALAGFSPVPYIAQAWSVGVEEQFYLIWPWLIKKTKHILMALLGVIGFYLLITLFLSYGITFRPGKIMGIMNDFWHSFNIDCMAIGGIAAYLLFYKKGKALQVLYHPVSQAIVYILILCSFIFRFHIPFPFEYFSVLFAIVILNLASNQKTILRLENKVFSYLGQISYGLYMYHYVMISLSLKMLAGMGVVNNVLIYILSLFLTVLISSISYEFFEKRFLKLKPKFSKILSGNDGVA
jgi:peptidoglycan/LPS O-acetylase OafA/YrhL